MTSLTGGFERPSLRCTGLVHTVAGSANKKLAQNLEQGAQFEIWAQKFGIGAAVWNMGAEVGNRGAEVWNTVRRSSEYEAQKFGIWCLIFKKVNADFFLPWPLNATRPSAFWSQQQGALIYNYMYNWWTGPLTGLYRERNHLFQPLLSFSAFSKILNT